jgi:hypothetical protein
VRSGLSGSDNLKKGCGDLSTDVKGPTAVVTLISGGVSQPSQSSRLPGAKIVWELAPLVLLEDCRGIIRLPLASKSHGGPEILRIHSGPESALVRLEPIPNRAVRLMQDGERKQKYQPSPQE